MPIYRLSVREIESEEKVNTYLSTSEQVVMNVYRKDGREIFGLDIDDKSPDSLIRRLLAMLLENSSRSPE